MVFSHLVKWCCGFDNLCETRLNAVGLHSLLNSQVMRNKQYLPNSDWQWLCFKCWHNIIWS